MALEYRVEKIQDDKHYSLYEFSYSDLQKDYLKFKNLSDKKFQHFIKQILHFSIYICYLKEIPSYYCLSDEGLIHQLCHLMLYKDEYTKNDFVRIRKEFNQICNLQPIISAKKKIEAKKKLALHKKVKKVK